MGAAHAGSNAEEAQVKEETQATLQCFPFAQPQQRGACFFSSALRLLVLGLALESKLL